MITEYDTYSLVLLKSGLTLKIIRIKLYLQCPPCDILTHASVDCADGIAPRSIRQRSDSTAPRSIHQRSDYVTGVRNRSWQFD